jgi:hypothetical protein
MYPFCTAAFHRFGFIYILGLTAEGRLVGGSNRVGFCSSCQGPEDHVLSLNYLVVQRCINTGGLIKGSGVEGHVGILGVGTGRCDRAAALEGITYQVVVVFGQ